MRGGEASEIVRACEEDDKSIKVCAPKKQGRETWVNERLLGWSFIGGSTRRWKEGANKYLQKGDVKCAAVVVYCLRCRMEN